MTNVKEFFVLIVAALMAIMILFGIVVSYRYYDVWSMEMQGKARLAEASQSRQIQVEQAKGEYEASIMRAKAIAVVGKAAKDYPQYRTQEFIGAFGEALREGKINQIMYVPTEANIPVTESTRLLNQ